MNRGAVGQDFSNAIGYFGRIVLYPNDSVGPELGSMIEQAIAKLRPEYRSCILLRHVEGRSYEEIAETLDLPLGTVKTYIHRARNELREYLEPYKE